MSAIEIVGCNGKNIGDILMLEAVVQELKARRPTIEFAVRRRSLLRRVAPGTALKHLPLIRASSRRQRLKNAINDRLLAPLSNVASGFSRMMAAGRISGIVDVCGYKYGGIWGAAAIDLDLQVYAREKQWGRKIVLLPKTYGPFSLRHEASSIRALVELADLCLCRDEVSHGHLVNAGVSPDACPVYPDYTTTVAGIPPTPQRSLADRALIIPNFRMADSQIGFTEHSYAAYLTDICAALARRGLRPVLLVHDAGRDLQFCQRLAQTNRVSLLVERQAVVVKGLIGTARVVYSDRLHGLISALSQTVPAVTSGWNHKYAEILKTYGMQDLLPHGQTHSSARCIDLMEKALAEAQPLRTRLAAATDRIKRMNALMWDRIVDCLFPAPDRA